MSEEGPPSAGLELSERSRLVERVVRGALIAAGLSPLLPALVSLVSGLSAFGDALFVWFDFQCHRDPARTLSILDALLPVCSRCAGIYFGLGLGAALLRPRLSRRANLAWLIAAGILMLLDIASETLGLRPAWPYVRLVTGLAFSYPISLAMMAAIRNR